MTPFSLKMHQKQVGSIAPLNLHWRLGSLDSGGKTSRSEKRKKDKNGTNKK